MDDGQLLATGSTLEKSRTVVQRTEYTKEEVHYMYYTVLEYSVHRMSNTYTYIPYQ